MTIAIILMVILGIATCVALLVSRRSLTGKKAMVLSGPKLSHVSRQLLREYNSLPAESRPVPDIVSILQGLDIKTEIDAEDREHHFDANWLPLTRVQNGMYRFDWKPPRSYCPHTMCKFREYYSLHLRIEEVADSIKEKERAVRMSQVDTDGLKVLEEGLRSEAKINKQVAKELE